MSEQPQLLLGLDCTAAHSVRLLLALDDGSLEPMILEHRSFRSRKSFQAYWKRFLDGRNVRVVAAGTLPWLDCCEAAAKLRPLRSDQEIRNQGSFLMWELPRTYQTAYQLLLLACYEANAIQALGLLQNNAACIRELMDESDRHLKLLTAALAT